MSQQTLFRLKKLVKSIYSGIEEDSLDELMMVMKWKRLEKKKVVI